MFQLGLCGLAAIAGFAYRLEIKNAKSFYMTTIIVILLAILLPLHILLNQSPLLWIFEQLFQDLTTVRYLYT